MSAENLIVRADAVYDSWEAGKLSDEVALSEVESIINEAREQNAPDALLAGMNNRTILLRFMGKFESALRANQEMMVLARQENSHRHLSYATYMEGDILRIQGKIAQAREAFHKAYIHAQAAPDHLAEAYALHMEGVIILGEKLTDTAQMLARQGLACIEQYIRTAPRTDPIYTSLQSSLYQLLARCALSENDLTAAWGYARTAMERAEVRHSAIEIGSTFELFAALTAHNPDQVPDGMSQDIDHYFTSAINHLLTVKAGPEIATTFVNYAHSLRDRSRTPEAIPFLEEAIAVYRQLNRPLGVMNTNTLLAQYRKEVL
jgi:tetratricopeptide (TPR) repeat protein